MHTSTSRSCSRFDSVWVRMHSHGLSILSGVDGDRCEWRLNMRKFSFWSQVDGGQQKKPKSFCMHFCWVKWEWSVWSSKDRFLWMVMEKKHPLRSLLHRVGQPRSAKTLGRYSTKAVLQIDRLVSLVGGRWILDVDGMKAICMLRSYV